MYIEVSGDDLFVRLIQPLLQLIMVLYGSRQKREAEASQQVEEEKQQQQQQQQQQQLKTAAAAAKWLEDQQKAAAPATWKKEDHYALERQRKAFSHNCRVLDLLAAGILTWEEAEPLMEKPTVSSSSHIQLGDSGMNWHPVWPPLPSLEQWP